MGSKEDKDKERTYREVERYRVTFDEEGNNNNDQEREIILYYTLHNMYTEWGNEWMTAMCQTIMRWERSWEKERWTKEKGKKKRREVSAAPSTPI